MITIGRNVLSLYTPLTQCPLRNSGSRLCLWRHQHKTQSCPESPLSAVSGSESETISTASDATDDKPPATPTEDLGFERNTSKSWVDQWAAEQEHLSLSVDQWVAEQRDILSSSTSGLVPVSPLPTATVSTILSPVWPSEIELHPDTFQLWPDSTNVFVRSNVTDKNNKHEYYASPPRTTFPQEYGANVSTWNERPSLYNFDLPVEVEDILTGGNGTTSPSAMDPSSFVRDDDDAIIEPAFTCNFGTEKAFSKVIERPRSRLIV